MIITVAIAVGLVKGLFLDTKSSTPASTSTVATTTTTITTVINATTAENTNVAIKEEATKPKQTEDKDIPYVSVSDCNACPTPCPDQEHLHYPSYLKIDHETPLLHSTKTYTRHVLISTGQDDWTSSIYDDTESLAPYLQKAIDEGQERLKEANGGKDLPRIVLTNSSRKSEHWEGPGWQVIILPDHIVVNNVTPEQCDDFFEAFLKPSVGSVIPGKTAGTMTSSELAVEKDHGEHIDRASSSNSSTTQHQDGLTTVAATHTVSRTTVTTTTTTTTSSMTDSSLQENGHHRHHYHAPDQTREVTAGKTTFVAHRWQPGAAIMICSHRKRDKRCGVTAAILKKEFMRILRSKDLYGDGEGDIEIWLISHIGGHKFAGNVIVHKSEGMAVWYGRVEPCHAQAIVETTIEKGQVIKELYRGSMIGSFDPTSKKIAW
ncbi:hypothetical protein BGX28_008381 [Mortierella sp. GBA30]|nr:hypothetical protein BGX28_008381 [Mortierella sp. GBA30]